MEINAESGQYLSVPRDIIGGAWPGNRRNASHYFVVMRGKLILMSCSPAVITNIMIMDLT